MDRAIRFLKPYLWGLLVVAACSGIKVLLGALIPWTSPYLFFIVGVVVVAYNFGFGPGLATAIESTLVAELVFARFSVLTPGQTGWERALTFMVQALPVCYICGVNIRSALDRHAALEAERATRLALATTSHQLAQSEERYRGMIAAVPQIVFVADTVFAFEWVNDRWESVTGLTESDATGAGWLRAVDPEDRRRVEEESATAVRERRVLNTELRLLESGKHGRRWYLARAVPILESSGAVSQWIGTFTDIDDSKLLMETMQRINEDLESRVQSRTDQLVAVNRELESANSELEAFCYAVSHDLRTPLRAIDGFSQALFQDFGDRLPEDGLDYLERVRSGARRMDELITSLLKLSRIARQELSVQKVNVSEIALNAWTDLENAFDGHSAEIDVQSGLAAPADAKLLRIVFDNLLGNALKFTIHQPAPKIKVGAERTERGYAFYVRDNGVGFSMEYASKLFTPFERLHSSRDYPGSGVGLATVMRCVRKHGGDAWASSVEGQGATFYFTLAPKGDPLK